MYLIPDPHVDQTYLVEDWRLESLPYLLVMMNSKYLILKASEEEASRLYELNLLAFVLNKFDFWGPKCPNYENIEF